MADLPTFLAQLQPAQQSPAPAPEPSPAPAKKPPFPEQLVALILSPPASSDALATIKAFLPQYEIPTTVIAQICDRGPDASYSAETIAELRKMFGLVAPEPVALSPEKEPKPKRTRRSKSTASAPVDQGRNERLQLACAALSGAAGSLTSSAENMREALDMLSKYVDGSDA